MLIWALPIAPLAVIAGAVGAFILASEPAIPPPSQTDLAGTSWQVDELAGSENAAPPRQTLTFAADGQVSGDAGCNRYFGPYRTEGRTIAIGPLAATRMACADPVMTRERTLLDALGAAAQWQRYGPSLTLLSADGEVVLRLTPLPD